MKLKRSIAIIFLTLISAILPLTAFATEGDSTPAPFTLNFECKIDGKVPQNTDFVFEVMSADLQGGDTERLTNETKLNDFTVSTKTNTDGKLTYNFGSETPVNKYFCLTLKSCSNKLATVIDTKIEVRFIAGKVQTTIHKGEEIEVFLYPDDESPIVTIDLATLPQITLSTDGCEAITKVYDGKLDATVTDKNFKVLGVQEGHDVKFSFEKAEYDTPDVKTATKVILSGLKLTGNDAAKYGFASSTLTLKATITPRPITVTADNLVMSMGAPEPKLTYTLSENLLPGNTATGELERTLGNKVGDYPITIGTLSLGDNYVVTFVEGKLTISSFGFFQVLDRNSSVKIAGYFNPGATVSASALDPNSETYSILATSAGWGKIVSAYDVKFTSDGFDGNITVYLPIDSSFEGKEITVYQKKADNSIACYKLTAIGGYVPVETNECTQFMLVTEADETEKSKGSVAWKILKVIIIILAVIIGLGLVIALLFFGMIFFNKTAELKKIIRLIKKLFKK